MGPYAELGRYRWLNKRRYLAIVRLLAGHERWYGAPLGVRMAVDNEPGAAAPATTRWEKWQQFLWGLVFSVGSWWLLLDGGIEDWKWFAVVLAALVAPVWTVVTFLTAFYDWSDEKSERIATKTFLWVFGAPIALAAVWYFLGRLEEALGGTPWWAVVIIILLVLILIQQYEQRK